MGVFPIDFIRVFNRQDAEFGSDKIFYKVTRENVMLTMEANLILGDMDDDL